LLCQAQFFFIIASQFQRQALKKKDLTEKILIKSERRKIGRGKWRHHGVTRRSFGSNFTEGRGKKKKNKFLTGYLEWRIVIL